MNLKVEFFPVFDITFDIVKKRGDWGIKGLIANVDF